MRAACGKGGWGKDSARLTAPVRGGPALVYDAWRAMGVMPNSARPSKLAMSKDFAPRAFAETIDGVRMKPLIPVRQDVTK